MKCTKCNGTGKYLYSDTGTWLSANVSGMMFGSAFTEGTCDMCWGSGNEDFPGENLLEKWKLDNPD